MVTDRSSSRPVSDDEEGRESMIKRRRTHAVRSCLACRKRKARCMLPDVTVTSSQTPLKESLACHRCKSMGIECVVWDGDRKGKRYTAERIAKLRGDEDEAESGPATKTSPHDDEILAPFYTHDPSFRATLNAEQDREESQSLHDTPTKKSRSVGDEVRQEVSSIMNGTFSLAKKTEFINSRLRPMLTLSMLLQRQDLYRCGLPVEFQRLYGTRSPSTLLAELLPNKGSPISSFGDQDLGLMVFHCHLPRLHEAVQRYRSAPSISTALLACVMMYLCKVHKSTQKVNVLLYVTRYYAVQVYLRAPRQIEAAQGLELVAVHLPFLLHEDENEEAGRGLRMDEKCPPAGSNLLNVALTIMSSSSDVLLSDEENEQRDCVKASLHAWHLAVSLYEPNTGNERRHVDQDWLARKTTFKNTEDDGVRVRQMAQAALKARLRTLTEAESCRSRIAELARDQNIDDELYKASQVAMMNDYLELQKDERARRIVTREEHKQFKRQSDRSVACTDALWLWIDLEAIGFHQKALASAIGSTYVRFLENENRKSDGKANAVTFCPGFSQLWKDPRWAEHISLLGVRRNDEISELMAQATKLRTSTFWPVLPVCATLLMTAKTMLDAQTVILHHLCRVHKDTETYVVILRSLAAMLGDESKDVDMPTLSTGAREIGIARCTSKVMHVAADTMSDWQDRQAVVLARHRIAEKKMRDDQVNSAMQTPVSDSTTAGTNNDSLFGLDPLFQGLLDMPILEDFFQQNDLNF